MSNKLPVIARSFRAAFPHTLPIWAGFWFLGFAYGILMNTSGFAFWYPMAMSCLIFGGSLEFLAVSILTSAFAPVQTLLVTLMIQARHLFYGIAMLDKYRGLGWKRFYLIFGLCDETFSIVCSAQVPEDVDRGWFYFFVTALNQFYWVSAATMGGIMGEVLRFDTQGLDFVMTAMFVVILLEHWLKEPHHICTGIGMAASLVCLMIFGPDSFLIPTMICILLLLTGFRKPVEQKWEVPAK